MTDNKRLFEAQIQNKDILEEFEVQRWLRGKSQGTKQLYLGAIKAFIEFTKLTTKQLIDLADEDRKKSSPRDRGDPEFKVSSFFEYLVNDYVQKGRGNRNRTPNGKKGLSRTLASSFCNGIRGFYKQNGFPLIVSLPKTIAKKENQKLQLRIPEIKRLYDVLPNLRDKAILLTILQSGLGVHELCNLTYGDVAKGLESNEEPLHLHLIRKKEMVEFDTFVGSDAIDALKSYLAQRSRDGEQFRQDSPLFRLQHTSKLGRSKINKIYPNLVENSITRAALKSGLISAEILENSDICPCRPHAIRAAFISILKNNGMNNTIVEYLCGHAIPAAQKPYWICDTNELAKIYKQYERFLSINSTVDNQKLEELENKSKTFEEEAKKNKGFIDILYQNSSYKDAQINNMTALLNQVQESLTKINSEQDFHRLEDVTRFVAAKAPTKQELIDFMIKRQIPQNILRRDELHCLTYSLASDQWLYCKDDDNFNLIMA